MFFKVTFSLSNTLLALAACAPRSYNLQEQPRSEALATEVKMLNDQKVVTLSQNAKHQLAEYLISQGKMDPRIVNQGFNLASETPKGLIVVCSSDFKQDTFVALRGGDLICSDFTRPSANLHYTEHTVRFASLGPQFGFNDGWGYVISLECPYANPETIKDRTFVGFNLGAALYLGIEGGVFVNYSQGYCALFGGALALQVVAGASTLTFQGAPVSGISSAKDRPVRQNV